MSTTSHNQSTIKQKETLNNCIPFVAAFRFDIYQSDATKRKEKKKKTNLVILPNFKIYSGHNGRLYLASKQVLWPRLTKSAVPQLIKCKTLAEEADAIGQFS